MTDKPKLLSPRAASAYYIAAGLDRGRSTATLTRLRTEGTGPKYIRDDVTGGVFYPLEELDADIERLTLRPRFRSVAEERAAGEPVPNTGEHAA